MRQKDVNRVAEVLEREMVFALETEIEGLQAAIGALVSDISWAQPELDMTPLKEAMRTLPIVRGGWRL